MLFAIKGWWISDYIAIHENQQATLTVECLASATAIEFNITMLNEIHSLFPEFEAVQRKSLERLIVSMRNEF